MPARNLVESVREAMLEEMEADPSVIVLGEDVGRRGGVFRATQGLIERFGEKRVIDTPLAESLIVGLAIGASLNGLRPIAEIQFADFIPPAFDQLLSEAAKIRYRSNGDYGCPIVVRAPFGGGIRGALYHSQSMEAIFAHVPGLKVVAPSTPYDAKGLLKAAIRDPDPVLFFEHKATYRLAREEVPAGDYTVPIGEAKVVREGSDLTVVSYGLMLHRSLAAARALAEDEGIEAEVIDLRTLLPLDREAILRSVRKTGRLLIVHEDNRTGGIGAEVAATVAEAALFHLDAPIRRVAGPDVPAIPFSPPLEEAYLPSADTIARAMRELARF